MSSIKAQLKAVGEAIKQQKWDDAAQQAQNILSKDAENYQAHIFLGFALASKGNLPGAEAAYTAASQRKPSDPQAWQGLIRVYSQQGPQRLDAYQTAATQLALAFSTAGDLHRAQDTVDKFLGCARGRGSRAQLAAALGIILPDSPVYAALEGRVAAPARTYEAVAQIEEAEERRRVNTLVGERRTRVGARLADVTAEVKREVLGASRLGGLYRGVIGWAADDEVRRTYEEKLLAHCYERLVVFAPGSEEKGEELREVRKLAGDMVIIKHPFKLAWDVTVDWQDLPNIGDWDVTVLREYCSFFPDSDLTRVLNGFLTSDVSPFPPLEPEPKPAKGTRQRQRQEKVSQLGTSEHGNDGDGDGDGGESEDEDEDGGVPTSYLPVTEEDRLLMMTDGVATADSLLAFRLLGEYYQHLEEHESNAELMRKAMEHVAAVRIKTGLTLRHYEDAFSLYLGTAFVYWQSPRHHSEAKALFDAVLAHDPLSTAALIGVGLIYEEEEDYDEARAFLERALQRDTGNLRVRAEAAWVTALKGDYAGAKSQLELCLSSMAGGGEGAGKGNKKGQQGQQGQQGAKARKELLALTQYRLGVCIWQLDPSRAARKDRAGAYALFLACLRSNVHFAPAYTSLGVFYADYARDGKRARRCFQKAVELSASEVVAAERLARSFADEADWERVELVARRVVDSGQVRPPPGSRRKGIAWPFAALGVAALNKQDNAQAVVHFQAALRIAPEDYHGWVGLGESYYASGRYIAATKALGNAMALAERMPVGAAEAAAAVVDDGVDTWFAQFMLASVKRELGDFDAAGDLYEQVLQSRPDEHGVTMALMQTMVENALDSLDRGLFGKAVRLASATITLASRTAAPRDTFNFWKAIGDACSVFSRIQSRAGDVPRDELQALLGSDDDGNGGPPEFQFLWDTDGVGTGVVFARGLFADDEALGVDLTRCLHASILAHKRALHCAAADVHAQAVSHYNLGWAEHRAHTCLVAHPSSSSSSRYLRAAVRCFKRAIELEAGNAAFWNALGVATAAISPRVAQHALARSLFLDERSAQAWTNLGALALVQGDAALANEALTRAQSTDPDYGHAWLGQALVALLLGHAREARALATHALALAGAESASSRRLYSARLFDHLIVSAGAGADAAAGAEDVTVTAMMQAVFALGQLQALRPQDLASAHLATLFHERLGDWARAAESLEGMCARLEADYDASASREALRRFVMARADLARSYLAGGLYDKAVECGQMVLDMTNSEGQGDGEGEGEFTAEERTKIRLSTHLSVGLAQHRNGNAAEAVALLETALEESNHNPDAVCLLAEVLWATGEDEQRERARTMLFEVVERPPSHAPSVVLLGVIALLDNDAESLDAVVAELQGLQARSSSGCAGGGGGGEAGAQAQAGDVLLAIAALGGGGGDASAEAAVMTQAQTDVMLHPHMPHGWSELAEVSGEAAPAEMALGVALRAVPPLGSLRAEDLAKAYASTGRPADAQAAVVTAPWMAAGWTGLADALEL